MSAYEEWFKKQLEEDFGFSAERMEKMNLEKHAGYKDGETVWEAAVAFGFDAGRDSRQCSSRSPQSDVRCTRLDDHPGAPKKGHMTIEGGLLWGDEE